MARSCYMGVAGGRCFSGGYGLFDIEEVATDE
jgi:hypothetical protein